MLLSEVGCCCDEDDIGFGANGAENLRGSEVAGCDGWRGEASDCGAIGIIGI